MNMIFKSIQNVDIRSTCNDKGKILAILPKGTLIQSEDIKDNWVKYIYNGIYVWSKVSNNNIEYFKFINNNNILKDVALEDVSSSEITKNKFKI
jgi:hypothetical protein